MKAKTVGDRVWPSISMAEGKGGMGGVRCAGGASRGELMRADVNEGEVRGTEDEDGVEP